MIKCDSEGVPLLIQHLRYMAGSMTFIVDFFDGMEMEFTTDDVCPDVGLMQFKITKMQYLQAENAITKLALRFWKELHD